MEKIFSKVEDFFDKKLAEFEKSPVKTSIKLIVTVWLLKTAYKWIMDKEEE